MPQQTMCFYYFSCQIYRVDNNSRQLLKSKVIFYHRETICKKRLINSFHFRQITSGLNEALNWPAKFLLPIIRLVL